MGSELTRTGDALVAYEPRSIPEALELAKLLYQSGLLPRSLGRPEAVLYALMAGRELGLTATQSLRSLHVIEGRVVMSADLIVALCKRGGACAYFRLVESSAKVATYETQRAGDPEPTRLSYTFEQATRAGLTGKQNWRAHPEAMLRARCAAALARAVYPDLCMGLYEPDEAEEIRGHHPPAITMEPDGDTPQPVADDIAQRADARGHILLAEAVAIYCDHFYRLENAEDRAKAFDALREACQSTAADLKRATTEELVKRGKRELETANDLETVEKIVRDLALLGLAKESPERAQLKAAYEAAVARLSPKTDGDPPKGRKRKATPVPTEAGERAAIEDPSRDSVVHDDAEAGYVQSQARWAEHVKGEPNEFAVAGAWCKRERVFAAAGVRDERLRAVLGELKTLLHTDSDHVCLNFVAEYRKTRGAARRTLPRRAA